MTTHISMHDLLAQETKRDSQAFYARLRAQAPLIYVESLLGTQGAWIVTSYDDALSILKDTRFTRDAQKIVPTYNKQLPDTEKEEVTRFITWRRDMLSVDPPDHTRLRGLVSKVFTPRMIEQLRPRIQQITDELLDTVQERGEMDLIAEFAFPLPITVICEMLGIPVQDRPQFRLWTQAMLNMSEDNHRGLPAMESMEKFITYIKTLVASKRTHPDQDLISGMVRVEENGETLSETELLSTIFLLIVAGHETTANLIGNGTLALLEHPEQLCLLQQDPSLIPTAVEELLRYTTPVTLTTPRWALEDVPMYDQIIHKGEMVMISLVAANIDPQHFSHPQELDVARQVNKHLAFGRGIHVCLGAPLARLEGQVAFSTLLRRLPNLHLAGDPQQLHWNRTPILRGLTSLPVTF
ncbi:cytochrome P450 family protein [Dictyobacter aurantiacus]|uniref:Cytochrome P450 n=1 Tax=Dictyobacter aurantiacus TaxID=1936993 RepID=A0A401ZL45_9CHLR|nr:cytochrome P450 [Dictyobacter aurantiacus]GCE07548.1 cytochrome P450 [Dictyobacter aurantiacus]